MGTWGGLQPTTLPFKQHRENIEIYESPNKLTLTILCGFQTLMLLQESLSNGHCFMNCGTIRSEKKGFWLKWDCTLCVRAINPINERRPAVTDSDSLSGLYFMLARKYSGDSETEFILYLSPTFNLHFFAYLCSS